MTTGAPKRYLILAEQFSGDPHYGKTLRGVMRYRRESVAAILDTTRAGEADDGVPIVATVAELPVADPTLVVADLSDGRRISDVAANLAACLAQDGHEIDLVLPDVAAPLLSALTTQLHAEPSSRRVSGVGGQVLTVRAADASSRLHQESAPSHSADITMIVLPPSAPRSVRLASGKLRLVTPGPPWSRNTGVPG